MRVIIILICYSLKCDKWGTLLFQHVCFWWTMCQGLVAVESQGQCANQWQIGHLCLFSSGPGRKTFSDLFIIAFTSYERNSSRLTFTPLHFQSMERCLFLTWGDSQATESLFLWPSAHGHITVKARGLCSLQSSSSTSVNSAQSFRSFHLGFHNSSVKFPFIHECQLHGFCLHRGKYCYSIANLLTSYLYSFIKHYFAYTVFCIGTE